MQKSSTRPNAMKKLSLLSNYAAVDGSDGVIGDDVDILPISLSLRTHYPVGEMLGGLGFRRENTSQYHAIAKHSTLIDINAI
jgi:hypothetical protein